MNSLIIVSNRILASINGLTLMSAILSSKSHILQSVSKYHKGTNLDLHRNVTFNHIPRNSFMFTVIIQRGIF